MKKWIIAGVLALVILVGAAYAFSDGSLMQGRFSGTFTQPDLVVNNVYLDAHNVINVDLANGGRASVPTSTNGHTFTYIDDMTTPVKKHSWTSLADKSFLTAGGSTIFQSTSLSDGEHEVKVCVDALDVVKEKSETNNCMTVTLEVVAPSTALDMLYVDVASTTPQSEIVVAGSSDNDFSTLKFTSINESFLIRKLSLSNAYGATVGDYDDDISNVYVQYYTDEAQTASETKNCTRVSSGLWTCTGLAMMVPDPDLTSVPNYALLTVFADINTLPGSADPGDKPMFTLTDEDDFDATGQDSGTNIDETTLNFSEDMDANFMQVQATDIDVAAPVTSRSGSVAVDEEILTVEISADSAMDAEIEEFHVDLTLNEAWASTSPTFSVLKQNGLVVAVCSVTPSGSMSAEISCIPSGTYGPITVDGTDTFVLELDTATMINDDPSMSEMLIANVSLGNVSTAGDIIWNDGTDTMNFCGVSSSDRIRVVTTY